MKQTSQHDLGLLFRTYNSLFLDLPFSKIEETGNHLALFTQECRAGFKAGLSPEQIVEGFWDEYFEEASEDERQGLLFYFIQYIERQVVLFDSVEDALFTQIHDLNGPGSLNYFLNRVHAPELQDKLREKLRDFSVRLVLTAHPTQFYPGKVLGIIDDLGSEISQNHLVKIRELLMQLGKTAFVNRQRPTPYDEALSLGWYLENVFYHALPDMLYRLLTDLGEDVTTFENPHVFALGFWPGGDRDGNPFVTAETTRNVARRLREGTLRCYYRDIRNLRRRLTFRGVEEKILSAEHRLYSTLYLTGNAAQYNNSGEFIADLLVARKFLIEEHDGLFLDLLDLFILKVRIFGFYFATLDLRQDSRKHGEVWDAIWQKQGSEKANAYRSANEAEKINLLLTAGFHLHEDYFPEESLTYDTIATLRQVANIQRENGSLGCHRYIISNCGSALNVVEVLALARLAIGEIGPGGAVPLDIVPLFETVEDLADAGPVMEQLYTHPLYSRHLAARGNKQTIMLGFSDGTKDGGYLRANWSIYRAKEALSAISQQYGVTVVFFDGRGGPPGRGGGNNAGYYAGHGAEIENSEIHVTIQGQTVSSTYGTIEAACYNTERLFTAGLENHLFQTHSFEMSEPDRQLLDELAEAAYKTYLELKTHNQFVPYLEKMTPLKWYGDSNIASRPAKRSGESLKFEDLRAIPFVGAWAQMKQNVPGYYGFGGALEIFFSQEKQQALQDLYKRSLFFRTLVENSMQSLSKSNFDVTRYLDKDPQFGPFWKMLHTEFTRTCQHLLTLSNQQELLSVNPISRQSIQIREDIVLPLIAIQQFGLQRIQQENMSQEQIEHYRKMVLRAMYGIINAARNAA